MVSLFDNLHLRYHRNMSYIHRGYMSHIHKISTYRIHEIECIKNKKRETNVRGSPNLWVMSTKPSYRVLFIQNQNYILQYPCHHTFFLYSHGLLLCSISKLLLTAIKSWQKSYAKFEIIGISHSSTFSNVLLDQLTFIHSLSQDSNP